MQLRLKKYQAAVSCLSFATIAAIKKAGINDVYDRLPSLTHTTVLKNNLVWVITFPHPQGALQPRPRTDPAEKGLKLGKHDTILTEDRRGDNHVAALRPEWAIVDTKVVFIGPMGGGMSWTGSRLAGDTVIDIHADDHRTGPIHSFKELLLRNERLSEVVYTLRRSDDFDLTIRIQQHTADKHKDRTPDDMGLFLIRWSGVDPGAILRFLRGAQSSGTKLERFDKIHLDLEFSAFNHLLPIMFASRPSQNAPFRPPTAALAAQGLIRLVQIDLMLAEPTVANLLAAPQDMSASKIWFRRVADDLFKIAGKHCVLKVDVKTKVMNPERGAREVKKDGDAERVEAVCKAVIGEAAQAYIGLVDQAHEAGWQRG